MNASDLIVRTGLKACTNIVHIYSRVILLYHFFNLSHCYVITPTDHSILYCLFFSSKSGGGSPVAGSVFNGLLKSRINGSGL